MPDTPDANTNNEEPVEFFHDKDVFGFEKKDIPPAPEKKAAPGPESAPPLLPIGPASDYQSVLSFCLLCILSFGIYLFFWFYKHWVYLRDEKGEKINLKFRAFFGVFYGYSLFSKFYKLALEKGYAEKPPLGILFVLYLAAALAVFSNTLTGLFLSFFSFLLLIPVLNMMNFYYTKEQAGRPIHKGLAKDEVVFLVIVWVIGIYLLFFAS